MSARTVRAAPALRPSPLFGVEIEVYIKVKPSFEAFTRQRRSTAPDTLPDYWKDWDFDLANNSTQGKAKLKQRAQISRAVVATIEHALGPDNGWRCDHDETLKAELIKGQDNPRKWCTYRSSLMLLMY